MLRLHDVNSNAKGRFNAFEHEEAPAVICQTLSKAFLLVLGRSGSVWSPPVLTLLNLDVLRMYNFGRALFSDYPIHPQ